ncbi:MAG TPA: hypothetical protein VNQ74_04790 [Burkholderiaceae bacterium]|nr:hypothetical protein [Burkholderiaceae bacterium]
MSVASVRPVIFDCEGVLVDSEPVAMQEYGVNFSNTALEGMRLFARSKRLTARHH